MKLQAPENCGGASFAGEPIELDENGQCEVHSREAIEALMDHGFVPVSSDGSDKKPSLKKK